MVVYLCKHFGLHLELLMLKKDDTEYSALDSGLTNNIIKYF